MLKQSVVEVEPGQATLAVSEACPHCTPRAALGFKFSMAFQPIIDLRTCEVFAHEALVRGMGGETAASVLANVNDENRYRFDQECRRKAIRMAADFGMDSALSINFLPNAVYEPANCLRATLSAAQKHDFPRGQIIFEITENERIVDPGHLVQIIQEYRAQGLRTAIDDFGAGYSGLNLLAEFQPDLIKLDMGLVQGIHGNRKRIAILNNTVSMCRDLGIEVIAEGIEDELDLHVVEEAGVYLVQGFLFAKPSFEALPDWELPVDGRLMAS